ncbi:MAG: MFS transporter [Planctomycetaceae bacterium]|nr:MAG: MFS transporter [Planctomycetaceae bacterium]
MSIDDRLPPAEQSDAHLPGLYQDGAFWGMTATQLFGAFNDNLFKQLMLLLAVPVGAAAVSQDDQQWLATVVFSLPFVLFSGYAGFLSDRFSKRTIILMAKMGELVVMTLGVLAFANYSRTGYTGLLVVLGLMGTQSAFFGPSKYGILPEMLRGSDLPRANGLILMTTFLAIIFGTASAGVLGQWLVDETAPLAESAGGLARGSAFCIGIAVVGIVTALWIRRVPPARPDLRFRMSALTMTPETRAVLRNDLPLLAAILASCTFWLVSGIAIQSINSLGLVQLELGKQWTSLLTAMIGVGIAVGAVTAGRMCRGRADPRVVRLGVWGIVAFLLILSISLPGGQHLLGFWGSLVVLMLVGVSAGLFAIPVQVYIQARPPAGQKGRMIAVMNQANFIAITLSGIIYLAMDRWAVAMDWPRSILFAMIAGLFLPVALFYRLPGDK